MTSHPANATHDSHENKSKIKDVTYAIIQSTLGEWLVILALIFGGCCSNAWALELATSQYPNSGTLITFAQFLLVSLFGLPKHLTLKPPAPIPREKLLRQIADDILRLRATHPQHEVLKIAIDGVDGAGKTCFANEIADVLRESCPHETIIRASVDGFHNPPEIRYALGRRSAEGFYRNSFNYQSLRENLLDPLGPKGSREYVTAVYDVETSKPVPPPPKRLLAPNGSILIFDGIFTHRAELRSAWDYSVFLQVPFDISIPRGAQRDPLVLDADPTSEKNKRYVEGQKLYIQTDRPLAAAAVVIDNSNLEQPVILKNSAAKWSLPNPLRIRLKKRSIPLSRWIIQVILFLITSLLNNAAFAYDIPMAVHIIFRSGGLVVNMIMGWLLEGKRYSLTQVFSVLLVTAGVAATTLSSAQSKRVSASSSSTSYADYVMGISILTLALVLSGAMGLAQDRAYTQYGRGHWQEGMFYLHFLALPMFAFVAGDLRAQIAAVNQSRPVALSSLVAAVPGFKSSSAAAAAAVLPLRWLDAVVVPSFYLPLALNIATQLLCVSGVHRLTSRVSSLTVTLVLVVRKAVSLGISVVLLRGGTGNRWLWGGALAVLLGTVGYSIGASKKDHGKAKKE